ncbi:MAG: FtsK/SpoIIIE domain-containing protein, partial [Verrucomicrobiota bacterium]
YFTARSEARSLVQRLVNAKAQLNHAWELATEHHQAEATRIKTEAHDRIQTLNHEWEAALADAARRREDLPSALEQKQNRVSVRNDQGLNRSLQLIETSHEKIISELKTHSQERLRKLEDSSRETWQNVEKKFSHANEELVALSRDRLAPPADLLRKMAGESEFLNPPWDSPFYTNWSPPPAFVPQIRFAWLDLNLANFSGTSASEKALGLPAEFSVPLSLSIPDQGSLLIESPAEGKDQAIAALNNLMLRILSASPLGKVAFTIFDPVNLGQNFAGITHLADFEPNLIDGRIWTQPEQFEERLSELNEHMEKVIQMYLRNEYSDIAAYNKAAGNIAEKYHFLVMADFPVNLSESASRKLLRIISSGARCGVYTLMHWDPRQVSPPEFLVEELQRHSIILKYQNGQFTLAHPSGPAGRLRLDQPPAPALANKLLTRIGEMSRGSNQVKVPFTQVAPGDEAIWSLDTSEELRVPIGRSGANKLQYLSLGRGTRQHALVAGKTGSGKSTLFHVLITNLALWASPDQVEFYLIDFKKGVEFRAYAAQSLPHARVVAIESDREFGLSVLHRLDDELRRRGEIFRKASAQDLTGFRRTHPNEPMPRTLLIIDEFQEFFVEEDRISQTAAMLLDRIVRQGRAFGIHVILGSQTLGGAFTLARSTIGQMVIRIALQCNEADAYLIMDESNPAPRLLSRPGEGIYNDMAGAIEGNSPFQTVWLPEPERADRLRQIHTIAESRGVQTRPPIVFEGNAPAEIRGNAPLAQALDAPAFPAPAEFRFWLGAPNAIKGPTEAIFRNRSGSNLIMVGQNEEATLSLLLHGVIAFRAQFPNDGAQWLHFSAASPNSIESQRLQTVLATLPNPPTLLYPGDIDKTLAHLLTRLEGLSSPSGEDGGPSGQESGPDPVLLVIHGLQNFKRLRVEDEFAFNTDPDSPASAPATLQRLITEGPNHGIHIIVTLDNFNNVSRFIGRKLLAEFEMRVLFQMSANDSVSLCDSPKANLLGLHRAILYNEHEGTLETFRPYSMPDPGWLETVRQKLSAKAVPQDS